MDWNIDNLTPEERERILAGSQLELYCIIVDRLLQETPVKPYTPPDEDIPPSPYIPLALRMPPMPSREQWEQWMKMKGSCDPPRGLEF